MKLKIAIIDDEPTYLYFIDAICNRQAWELRYFSCAETFLKCRVNEDYDLIITDYMMEGGINGIELCRILKDQNNIIPIILFTAAVEDFVPLEIFDCADKVLFKPIKPTNFIQIVEEMCGNKEKFD
jgi:two-component system alkaline phosphatase synthesis response regulator PhoP